MLEIAIHLCVCEIERLYFCNQKHEYQRQEQALRKLARQVRRPKKKSFALLRPCVLYFVYPGHVVVDISGRVIHEACLTLLRLKVTGETKDLAIIL